MTMQQTPIILSLKMPFYPIESVYDKRTLFPMDDPARMEAYVAALRREIEAAAPDYKDCIVQAVHIGGGIASHAADEPLGVLLRDMRRLFSFAPDAEITLNVHPGMISVDTLTACRRGRVTRLSVDYATSDPFESEAIGRFLPPSAMDTSALVLSGATLELSFDILVGINGQSEISLTRTLQRAADYGAREIVLHPFEVCPNTPYAQRLAPQYAASTSPRKHLPDEKERAALLRFAEAWLSRHGYALYAPGRFALPNCASRYHSLRQAGCPMLGFGAGARTRMDGIEAVNTLNLDTYMRHADEPDRIIEHVHALDERAGGDES